MFRDLFYACYLTFFYLLAQVSLSCLLHLCQHHSRDLFRSKCLHLTTNVDLNMRLALFLCNLSKNIHHCYFIHKTLQIHL